MRGIVMLISVCVLCTAHDKLSPVVKVQQGHVQGTIKKTEKGNSFFAFRGIPYAKPPLGKLRFKAPVPPDPWTGVLRVDTDSPICIQIDFERNSRAIGSEDCLQLNVYTPQLPDKTSKPLKAVHVFIHGGGFLEGDINFKDVNPGWYIDADIILVAMKYRIGPIGFLSTNDEAASGNWGLLDQNLALKWVQKNIAAFGGDPNDVTLSGQSAGGASVIMHYQSPMSAGLFHRAIAESGSSLCPWAVEENPLTYATLMGQYFNCDTDDTSSLIHCLRSVPAAELVSHSMDIMVTKLALGYVPNVETSSSGLFLTENPMTALKAGHFNKVPLQLGFNKDEGSFIFQFLYFLFDDINNTTFDVIIPAVLYVISDYHSNLLDFSHAVRTEYFTGVDLSNQTDVNIAIIGLFSDALMKSWITKTALLVSSQGVPVYFYAFDHISNISSTNFTGKPDVRHSQEMNYLYWTNITNPKDAKFQKRFFPLWSQFILNGGHGCPARHDDSWLATPRGQYNYLEIVDKFTMEGNYDPQKMDFWWKRVPAIMNE